MPDEPILEPQAQVEPVEQPQVDTASVAIAAPSTPVQESFSVRDFARQAGHDLSSYQDDKEALGALLNRYSAADRYERDARAYQGMQPYLGEFNEYLQSKISQQRQAEEEARKKAQWEAPEWNEAWVYQVRKNPETGALEGDPAIVQKVRNYQDWRSKFEQSFFGNPREALKNVLVEPLKEELRKEFAQKLSQEKEYAYAQGLLHNATQQLKPDEWPIYGRAVQEIAAGGMLDSGQTHKLAMQQVALSRLQKNGTTPTNGAADTKNILAQQAAKRMPAMSGAAASNPESKESLSTMLSRRFKEQGVNSIED